jgi:plasmid stabilization system protein ParE
MVTYQVVISRQARTSLKEIHTYLKEEVLKETAEHVRKGILETIKNLSNMPQKHGIVREVSDEQIVFRRVLEWSYKIIFNILGV